VNLLTRAALLWADRRIVEANAKLRKRLLNLGPKLRTAEARLTAANAQLATVQLNATRAKETSAATYNASKAAYEAQLAHLRERVEVANARADEAERISRRYERRWDNHVANCQLAAAVQDETDWKRRSDR
jgi:hypothetical protein